MTLPGLATSTTGSAHSVSTSAVAISTLTSQSYSSSPLTTIQTIIESSFMTSVLRSTSTTAPVVAASSTSATPSTSLVATSQQMSSPSVTKSEGTFFSHHRNLVIILSSVLGVLGLLLIVGIIVLIVRYRRQQAPFGPRGASPIDDEEIASWRRSEQEKRHEGPPPEHKAAVREVPRLPIEHHTGWTWATTASSGSIHTVTSPFPDSPTYLATAPNARAGLTDETIPGEDPFITPPKRQNSRLSKFPPGHSRHRSRRSSFSAKSMLSAQGHSRGSSDEKAKDMSPTWYEAYDAPSGAQGAYLKEIDLGIDSPRTSIFADFASGGLSPRPKSVTRTMTWERSDDIGRAIA